MRQSARFTRQSNHLTLIVSDGSTFEIKRQGMSSITIISTNEITSTANMLKMSMFTGTKDTK